MSEPASADRRRLQVRVFGAVQGVGFRPFVHRLALRHGLDGWVRNDAGGVTLEVEGAHEELLGFLQGLRTEAPPAAVVAAVEHRLLRARGLREFSIRASEEREVNRAWVVPDLALCGDCRRELFDPTDRRHRYPFINCTRCGPRFTIIRDLPYDRDRTSMRGFAMCPACAEEYARPDDRRHHAQPDACDACGPQVALGDRQGGEALDDAVARLRRGEVLAVKGLGGYHLMADAGNEEAVTRLRTRKRRSQKAFAVMEPDLASLERHVELPSAARELLQSSQAPIVLLRRTAAGLREIAPSVAPGSPWLGVFLPYTPLHALLLADLGRPVVATSGNASDEPIEFRDVSAGGPLAAMADAVLTHDRPILRPADDSVVQLLSRPRPRSQTLRRARGYAPLPVLASRDMPPLLALGGHMNAALAISRGREIILSQHLGDVEGYEARELFRRTLDDLPRLFGVRPGAVVHDRHPDYFTTGLARELGLPRVEVQHHHAHLAACMLENELEAPVLGLTWDGTGYGPDGTVWGGELLLGGPVAVRRVGSLVPFGLPGGEVAAREPWRAAVGLWCRVPGVPQGGLGFDGVEPVTLERVSEMARGGVRSPTTTSVGRLFDGVAAMLGLCTVATHQAHAAQQLEWRAWSHGRDARPLGFAVLENGDELRIDWRPALAELVERRAAGEPVESLAAAFHHGLAAAAVEAVTRIATPDVALTGGVFCNRYLTELLAERLEGAGFGVHLHGQLPPTDGSLAAGQIWVAAHLEPGA